MHGGLGSSAGSARGPRHAPRRRLAASQPGRAPGRSAPPAVTAAPRAPGCGPGLPSSDGAARHGAPGHLRAGPRPGPSQSARTPLPARTATARPSRAHGRGLLGPMPPRAWARLAGSGSLRVPVVGPAAAAPGAPRPQQMVAEPRGLPGGAQGGRARGGGSTRGRASPRSAALLTNGSGELQLTKKSLDQWKPGAGTKGGPA